MATSGSSGQGENPVHVYRALPRIGGMFRLRWSRFRTNVRHWMLKQCLEEGWIVSALTPVSHVPSRVAPYIVVHLEPVLRLSDHW